MKSILVIILSLSLSSVATTSFANEKSYSTPNRAAVVVDGDNVNQRICYYQGKAYSEGSLLEVGGFLLRCEQANHYETNGLLKWQNYTQDQQDSDKR